MIDVGVISKDEENLLQVSDDQISSIKVYINKVKWR